MGAKKRKKMNEVASRDSVPADQLAHLAQALAPAIQHHPLYEVLGRLLTRRASQLSAAGRAAIEAAFPGGEGPSFPSKASMLIAVKEAAEQAASIRDDDSDSEPRKEVRAAASRSRD